MGACEDFGNAEKTLFQPLLLGRFLLSHRIVMAPMTRSRSPGHVPPPEMAVYYAQRATDGGLLITEGTAISPYAHGYPDVPGIYTSEQVSAWKAVTAAVHEKQGIIFMQLWHVGRVSHPEYQPNGELPIAPSAIAPSIRTCRLKSGQRVPYVAPRALDKEGIAAVVGQYRAAAAKAIEAGCDGVEIHGANGYIIDQFLKDAMNKRNDEYGGSIGNRCRFCLEVVDAVCDEVGSDRVGLRLLPFTPVTDESDSNTYELYTFLLKELNKRNLAFVHLIEPDKGLYNFDHSEEGAKVLEPLRVAYKGVLMVCGGYTRELGIKAIETGHADVVVYGRPFLANPDIVHRFHVNAPLNTPDMATFYTPGPKGYIDYPTLEQGGGQ